MDIEALRGLDEAMVIGSEGEPMNMVDISIQKRAFYIGYYIRDDIEYGLKLITFFILADQKHKPGEYIHRLILNRSVNVSRAAEMNIAYCLYLLPMVHSGKLPRDNYNKVYDYLLKKGIYTLSDTDYQAYKDIVAFYDYNSGQLGILSYLY